MIRAAAALFLALLAVPAAAQLRIDITSGTQAIDPGLERDARDLLDGAALKVGGDLDEDRDPPGQRRARLDHARKKGGERARRLQIAQAPGIGG